MKTAVKNRSEMSRRVGVSEGTVRNWLKGQEPSSEDLARIAKEFDKPEEWILFGIEHSEIKSLAAGRTDDKVIYINLVNVIVGAGNGHIVWSEEIIDKLTLTELFFRVNNIRSNPADLSAVTVDGESMMPYMLPGDIVMVDHSQTTPCEAVFVVRSNDAVMIKRLQPMIDGRIRIFSYNPDWKEDFVTLDNPNFAIIGRVVWGGRRF